MVLPSPFSSVVLLDNLVLPPPCTLHHPMMCNSPHPNTGPPFLPKGLSLKLMWVIGSLLIQDPFFYLHIDCNLLRIHNYLFLWVGSISPDSFVFLVLHFRRSPSSSEHAIAVARAAPIQTLEKLKVSFIFFFNLES